MFVFKESTASQGTDKGRLSAKLPRDDARSLDRFRDERHRDESRFRRPLAALFAARSSFGMENDSTIESRLKTRHFFAMEIVGCSMNGLKP